jgi:hypothetical protein
MRNGAAKTDAADDRMMDVAAMAETTCSEMRILLSEVRMALRISVALKPL